MILSEEGIPKLQGIQEVIGLKKNDQTFIDILLIEGIPYSTMNQVIKKEVIKYNTRKKSYYCYDETLRTYKIKENIDKKIGNRIL